jgi:hypothetical protein
MAQSKKKARIAAVHTMVEAMIQGDQETASSAFKTYMQVASREILLGEGSDEDEDEDETEMTDDDNDETINDTSDDDMDDDNDEESDEDSDEESDDDEVDVKMVKMEEGKKGVNPFAKKSDEDDDKKPAMKKKAKAKRTSKGK